MPDKTARAPVEPVRQRTQYTCMATSLMMCLRALGIDTTEDEVNKVMGARPMRGASWEQGMAAAQHYGARTHLTMPATLRQLKAWTDQGIPVMIAWNPEGRDWSHASVVFDVEDDFTVHIADPNIPDPDETVRVVSKSEFYGKWYEKWPDYLVRRPAMAVTLEVTQEGRQVMAKTAASYGRSTLHPRLAVDGKKVFINRAMRTKARLRKRRHDDVWDSVAGQVRLREVLRTPFGDDGYEVTAVDGGFPAEFVRTVKPMAFDADPKKAEALFKMPQGTIIQTKGSRWFADRRVEKGTYLMRLRHGLGMDEWTVVTPDGVPTNTEQAGGMTWLNVYQVFSSEEISTLGYNIIRTASMGLDSSRVAELYLQSEAGKRHRRRMKDRARSDKLKGKRPTKKRERTEQEKAEQAAAWRERKEQGQAGMPGKGRGGPHKGKGKGKSRRRDRQDSKKELRQHRSAFNPVVRDRPTDKMPSQWRESRPNGLGMRVWKWEDRGTGLSFRVDEFDDGNPSDPISMGYLYGLMVQDPEGQVWVYKGRVKFMGNAASMADDVVTWWTKRSPASMAEVFMGKFKTTHRRMASPSAERVLSAFLNPAPGTVEPQTVE